MKKSIWLIMCILVLVFSIEGYADSAWKCSNCGQQVQSVLGDVCPYCGAKKHEHSWRQATCTEPKTCSECGKTEGAALGHQWTEATCTVPKTCTVCGATEGEALGHQWTEATCTDPKRCTVCGVTEGEALGHQWTEATCTDPKRCTVCGATEGEALGHQWAEATCTEPMTCTVCGMERGEALGHVWRRATCTEPKTCTVCEKTEGEALGHAWRIATCTEPKTCTVCGVTEGEALGHQWREVTGTRRKTCIVCGETEGTLYFPGTYTASALGVESDVTVEVTVDENFSKAVNIDVSGETAGLGAEIGDEMAAKFLAAQSADVDVHAGASVTSEALKTAFADALSQATAGPAEEALDETEASSEEDTLYIPGTYTASAPGVESYVTVEITVDENSIKAVNIDVSGETAGLGAEIGDEMAAKFLVAQSADVDVNSGATITSDALKAAMKQALAIAAVH